MGYADCHLLEWISRSCGFSRFSYDEVDVAVFGVNPNVI